MLEGGVMLENKIKKDDKGIPSGFTTILNRLDRKGVIEEVTCQPILRKMEEQATWTHG